VPTVWTDWKQDGHTLDVTLHQSEPTYRLVMPLVVTFKDGTKKERDVVFDSVSTPLNLTADRPVLAAELDPDHETFHSTPELDAEMKDLSVYWQVDCFNPLLQKTQSSDAMLTDALAKLPNPDRYGAEFLLRFTLGGNLRREGKNAEAKAELEKALACPVRRADFVPIAFLRLALIAKSLGQPAEVDRCLDAMMSAEATLKYSSSAVERARQLFPGREFGGL
jgi:hypothetical protein